MSIHFDNIGSFDWITREIKKQLNLRWYEENRVFVYNSVAVEWNRFCLFWFIFNIFILYLQLQLYVFSKLADTQI